MTKKRKRLIVFICISLLTVSFAILASTIFVIAYANRNINTEGDEILFSLTRGSSVTEYYVDADYNAVTVEEYTPVLKESIALGSTKKRWVELKKVPSDLINGFLAMEDRVFYSHHGVNLKRTLYALANSVFHFKSTFGASTITQQVIKNISGDNELTLKRKFNEIIRAYCIEKNHTKDEIFEVYINIIPLGENITGVSFASEIYFGKAVDELTLSECATLVGITNAPTRFNPHIHYEDCLKKRNDVLYAMLDFGVIDEKEYDAAVKEKLSVLPLQNAEEIANSWFTETVNEDVITYLCKNRNMTKEAAEAYLINGGLKIYTTENPEIQSLLERYFENKTNFSSYVNKGLDYSMVICDSQSGNLLGIVGSVGKKSANRLLNLATVSHTPGSAIKPIALYAPLINRGKINWATVFDDVPVEFNKVNGNFTEYPKNYPAVYDGLTTVKDAIRLSKNTVAVRLYNMLGAEEIYRSLRYDYNFDTLVRSEYDGKGNRLTDLASSPLALGQFTRGVSLRKLTEAYTVFPSEGIYSEGRSFIAVFDSDGRLIIDNSQNNKRLISKECARVMNQLLSCVTESGTASKVTLKNIVDTAGKTGTSGDDKDRVFIGYTPYITAGIWCGYRDSDTSIGKVFPTHIKIWDDIMSDIHSYLLQNKSDSDIAAFSKKGLIKRDYCMDSGKLFTDICAYDPRGQRIESGYFIKGYAPSDKCDRHVLCQYDSVTEGIASEHCPVEFVKEIALLRINDRHFPKEIVISDADYVYYELETDVDFPQDYSLPYYYNTLEEGVFVGRGKKRKQFNSYCYLHDGE